MTGFTDVFGGSTLQAVDVSYRAISLTASATTVWPQYATSNNQVARLMDVSASSAGFTLSLPDATLTTVGQDFFIANRGSNSFTLQDYSGGSLSVLTAGQVRYFYLTANATAAGTWTSVLFGAASSNLDASALAGYGIKAIGATLNFAPQTTVISGDTAVATTDRGKVFVWNTGAGTLTLPLASTAGSDFSIEVRNQGSGILVLTPSGSDVVDGSGAVSLQVNESCFVHAGVGNWYTVGRGRNTQFNFTQLIKTVTGGSVSLSLTEAANTVQTYSGTLTSNCTVTLPAYVQVYFISNQTSGAFSLTFRTPNTGSTLSLPTGQNAVVFCDGTNVINASTSISGVSSIAFGAGSASNPSASFGTTTNGFYASGTNEVAVAINGAYAGKFSTSGLTVVNGLTVSSGGASISGNVAVAGDLSVSGSGGIRNTHTSAAYSFGPSSTEQIYRSGNTLRFYVNGADVSTLDASGNLLVGTTTSSGRLSIKASGTATYAAAFYDSTNTFMSGFYVGASGINGGYNGANCVQWIARDATTSRSINAGGTINASGADYAEYERNNGIKFAKGQIVGFKQDGTLTDIYADAIRFGVKSTNPAYVGGDAWGSDKQVGNRPDEPHFDAPAYNGPQDPGEAPVEPVQQALPEDASDEDKTKASEDFATAHAAWVAASADHEKLAYEYHAAQVDHAARVEVAKQLFDTDTYPEYQRALAAFEARLEAERQIVDRIAYCGKVPVAVYDATPGGYIIADKDSKGKIVGKFVADPDFAQYKKAVGRVNRIMDAEASTHLVEAINGTDPQQFVGMAEIAVIVH